MQPLRRTVVNPGVDPINCFECQGRIEVGVLFQLANAVGRRQRSYRGVEYNNNHPLVEGSLGFFICRPCLVKALHTIKDGSLHDDFALGLLGGDPVTRDMVTDILKL